MRINGEVTKAVVWGSSEALAVKTLPPSACHLAALASWWGGVAVWAQKLSLGVGESAVTRPCRRDQAVPP